MSPVSHSSKLPILKGGHGNLQIYSYPGRSVGSPGAPFAAGVLSGNSLVGLSPYTMGSVLTPDSVRTELNC